MKMNKLNLLSELAYFNIDDLEMDLCAVNCTGNANRSNASSSLPNLSLDPNFVAKVNGLHLKLMDMQATISFLLSRSDAVYQQVYAVEDDIKLLKNTMLVCQSELEALKSMIDE